MFICRIENKVGEVLRLTQDESEFQVVRIDGLNPPNAQINMMTMANIDGARYNSSKLETREIVLTIQLNGAGDFVEANRQRLYRFFPTKEWCKFYYTNNFRDVFIEAYANTVTVSPFDNTQQMQVSIICPQPYFKSLQLIIDDISKQMARFEFPFAFGSNGATNPDVPVFEETDDAIPFSEIEMGRITNVYNNSESECGMVIEINIVLPVNMVTIQNTDTGEFITIEHSFIQEDKIVINTNRGEKSISLIRNGISENIFPSLVKGSTFLQLNIGNNYFGYTLGEGVEPSRAHIIFKHHTVYRGV